MNPVPPLNSLRAFSVVAEYGGIRAASEALNVTQSSVSRHISILEEYLQRKLFRREGRGLKLTSAGQDYLLQISVAFETISGATTAIRSRSKRAKLTLSAPISLTANWLLPQIRNFLIENPEIDLTFTDALIMKPNHREIDCAIEYRFQPEQTFNSFLLLRDEIVPVISPHHYDVNKITSANNLRGITLIETARRLVSWQNILADQSWYDHQPIFSVNHTVHALEAARNGIGIALANRHNAQDMLKNGHLVTPFMFNAGTVARTPCYYFSIPPHKKHDKYVQRLQNWFMSIKCD